MDLDCDSEGIMKSDEEMGRDKPSGPSSNHNHYSINPYYEMLPEITASPEENRHSQCRDFREQAEERTSIWTKLKVIQTNITVEPLVFCSMVSEIMLIMCTRNLALEKSCRVNLALGEEICGAVTARNESYPNYTVHVEAVQIHSTKIMTWSNIILSMAPVLLLLFAGSWSDKHKRRKPCILFPVGGQIVMTLIYLICVIFFYQLPLEVSIVADAATALTGSWNVIFMGVFTYISGITTTENRTVRFGILNLLTSVSTCMGNALSGILYNETGFYGVFSLCLVLFSAAFVYGWVFIKDIREIEVEKGIYERCAVKKNFVVDFFDFSNLAHTLRACFRKGTNNRRARICSLAALAMIVVGPQIGETNVSYFFQRYKYGWDPVDASLFSTFQFVAGAVGILLSLAIFTKCLKMDDAILGVISLSSRIVGSIILAFAPTPFWFYVGALSQMLCGTAAIAYRAYVSKFIPPEDLGQVNSVIAAIEALTLLVYGPLYNWIYVATIDIFSSAFYLVGAASTVPGVVLFIFLYVENQKDMRRAILQKQ